MQPRAPLTHYTKVNRMQQSRPPITDRLVRFALIGCGRIAQNHFEAIKKHADRAELVAVCDTSGGGR